MANLFISPFGEPFRGRPGDPYPSSVWFARADRNHDGRIDRDEFRADAQAYFHSLDTDGDGVVDGFEIAAYEQALPEILPRVRGLRPGEGMDPGLGRPPGGGPPRERPRRGGARGGGARQGAGPFTFLDQPQPVAAADTDFDRKVSRAEILAAADRRLAILDVDGDGAVTAAELPPTPIQAMAERQAGDRRRNPPSQSVGAGPARQPRPSPLAPQPGARSPA